MGVTFRPPKEVRPSYRKACEFSEASIFREAKQQVVKEIEETMALRGISRNRMSELLEVNPSALTQSLGVDRGIQLATLVRIAHVLGCDVEVNFIRRPTVQMAVAEDVSTLTH